MTLDLKTLREDAQYALDALTSANAADRGGRDIDGIVAFMRKRMVQRI